MSRWILWGFGATVFGALLVALLLPGDVLSTRLVGQWGTRINVARGALHTLPLVVAPSRQRIELCSDTWLRRETCVSIVGTVTGKQTVFVIPLTQPIGRALVKVIEEPLGVSQTTSQLQGRAFVNVSGGQQSAQSAPKTIYRQPIYIVQNAARPDTAPATEREPDNGGGAPRTEPRPDIPSSSLPTSLPSTPEPAETPSSTPGF